MFAQPLGSALALGSSCRESVLQPALGEFSGRPLCLSPRARGLRQLPYGLLTCMRGGATAGRSAPPGMVDSGPDGEPNSSQEGGRLLVKQSDRVAHKGAFPQSHPHCSSWERNPESVLAPGSVAAPRVVPARESPVTLRTFQQQCQGLSSLHFSALVREVSGDRVSAPPRGIPAHTWTVRAATVGPVTHQPTHPEPVDLQPGSEGRVFPWASLLRGTGQQGKRSPCGACGPPDGCPHPTLLTQQGQWVGQRRCWFPGGCAWGGLGGLDLFLLGHAPCWRRVTVW